MITKLENLFKSNKQKSTKQFSQFLPTNFPQCLATISTVYWKSNEESVEGDKPQKAPMLESRKAVAANTRADRVQGKERKILIPAGRAGCQELALAGWRRVFILLIVFDK